MADSPSLETMSVTAIRRSKRPLPMLGDDDDDSDGQSSGLDGQERSRATHNQIEKRRREKMNSYIKELENMVPGCVATNKKLDKLTVLKLAVQHLRELRGDPSDDEEMQSQKPTFLSDDELKYLILEAADGFLFVVGCELGSILYVSDSVSPLLQQEQNEWIGQRIQDIVHPRDVAKVMEQLAPNDSQSSDVAGADANAKRGGGGASGNAEGVRRSFFCRFRCGEDVASAVAPSSVQALEEPRQSVAQGSPRGNRRHHYAVVHVTGYVKSWDPTPENEDVLDDLNGNKTCLIAIARLQTMTAGRSDDSSGATEFMSRHTLDGKFSFVDQRVVDVLGYLPQELIGSSFYEFYHRDDVPRLAEDHKALLSGKQDVLESHYRFKSKSGQWVWLQSRRFGFRNPWTSDIDYIVSQNILASREPPVGFSSASPQSSLPLPPLTSYQPAAAAAAAATTSFPSPSSAVFSNRSSPPIPASSPPATVVSLSHYQPPPQEQPVVQQQPPIQRQPSNSSACSQTISRPSPVASSIAPPSPQVSNRRQPPLHFAYTESSRVQPPPQQVPASLLSQFPDATHNAVSPPQLHIPAQSHGSRDGAPAHSYPLTHVSFSASQPLPPSNIQSFSPQIIEVPERGPDMSGSSPVFLNRYGQSHQGIHSVSSRPYASAPHYFGSPQYQQPQMATPPPPPQPPPLPPPPQPLQHHISQYHHHQLQHHHAPQVGGGGGGVVFPPSTFAWPDNDDSSAVASFLSSLIEQQSTDLNQLQSTMPGNGLSPPMRRS